MNFIKKYSDKFSGDQKNLAVNFISLLALQGANYILPFITYPYLFRILGSAKFGILAFAQALAQYFILFTDYGFNLSAPRDISINREDPKKISDIFSSIMFLKIIMLAVSMAAITLIVMFIPKFKSNPLVYLFSFGMVIGNVLFPIWFFQGMEKMKYISFLNILSKTIFTCSIFLFIKKEEHYLYVPLINSLGYIVAGLLSLHIVFKEFGIRVILPTMNSIIFQLKDSFYFFLSRLSFSIYTITNTFILGMFTTDEITGYYAAVDKVIKAIAMLNQPIANALYPYMSRKKSIVFFKKIFFMWTLLGIFISAVFVIFSSQITSIIYGEGQVQITNLFRLYSLEFCIVFPSIILGLPLLAAWGHSKYLNMSIIVGSLIHIAGLIAIIPFINAYLIVSLVILTESIVFIIRIFGVKKYGLWKLSPPAAS